MQNACINAYLIEMWINIICEMNETPHLVIDISKTERALDVPVAFVVENQITLNVAPYAVQNFHIDKEIGVITFGARFNRVHHNIVIPCEAIFHIRAKESGAGVILPEDLMFYVPPAETGVDTGIPENHSSTSQKDNGLEGPDGFPGPNGPVGPNVASSGSSKKGSTRKKPNHLKVVK